jgi:hypothetical protein
VGSHPGEHLYDAAASSDQSRADFDPAWRVFSAERTEADYPERPDAGWAGAETWRVGGRRTLRSQEPNSMMPCRCGERFDNHDPAGS